MVAPVSDELVSEFQEFLRDSQDGYKFSQVPNAEHVFNTTLVLKVFTECIQNTFCVLRFTFDKFSCCPATIQDY